jgi:hypothetical protein
MMRSHPRFHGDEFQIVSKIQHFIKEFLESHRTFHPTKRE